MEEYRRGLRKIKEAALSNRLNIEPQTVHVTLCQVASAGIGRQFSRRCNKVVFDKKFVAAIRITKLMFDHAHEYSTGKVFVALQNIDVGWFDLSHVIEPWHHGLERGRGVIRCVVDRRPGPVMRP